MLMFDVDAFTQINDRYGRLVGDQVLRSVAAILRQRFRASDIVARVGADSFAVVLNGSTAEAAAEAAAQIRRQVHELQLVSQHGEVVTVTVATGTALYEEDETAGEMMRELETALDKTRWSGPEAAVAS